MGEELLPYIEPVKATTGACEDPDDDKFLACAVASKATFIVSEDAHLLSMKKFREIQIITVEWFLKRHK